MAKTVTKQTAKVQASRKAPTEVTTAKKASIRVVPTVNVKFVLLDLGAKEVVLAGDFNGWSADATPMKWHPGGHWETTMALAPGRYEYKYIVDGQWIPNPLAQEQVYNQFGTLNSVITVLT